MDPRPLLDGTELDSDRLLSTHPRVLSVDYPHLGLDSQRATVLDADFDTGSLPDWLSYYTDNGPTSPTLDGADASTVTLSTGSTASGDVSVVQMTDQLTWSDHQEIHVCAEFESASGVPQVVFGDDPDHSDMTEGFKANHYSGTSYYRIKAGGTEQNASKDTNGSIRMGFSVFKSRNNPGRNNLDSTPGYECHFYDAGETLGRWQQRFGWPADTGLTVSAGVRNPSGNDVSASLDRLLVIVV